MPSIIALHTKPQKNINILIEYFENANGYLESHNFLKLVHGEVMIYYNKKNIEMPILKTIINALKALPNYNYCIHSVFANHNLNRYT